MKIIFSIFSIKYQHKRLIIIWKGKLVMGNEKECDKHEKLYHFQGDSDTLEDDKDFNILEIRNVLSDL